MGAALCPALPCSALPCPAACLPSFFYREQANVFSLEKSNLECILFQEYQDVYQVIAFQACYHFDYWDMTVSFFVGRRYLQ